QGLATEGDAGQRVVDLVGHTGGQKANAGQALGADQLTAALVDLSGQVAVHLPEPAGHVVEGGRQVFHLVAAVDLDAIVKIALSHPAGALLQVADRVEDPAVEKPQQAGHRQDADHQRGQDRVQAELVIAAGPVDSAIKVVVN